MMSSVNPDESPGAPPTTNSGSVPDDSLAIHYAGSLTVRDAFEACSLAQPTSQKVKSWIGRSIFILALLYFGFQNGYFTLLYDYFFNGVRIPVLFWGIGIAVILLCISVAFGRALWDRWRTKQLWQQRKGLYIDTEGACAVRSNNSSILSGLRRFSKTPRAITQIGRFATNGSNALPNVIDILVAS